LSKKARKDIFDVYKGRRKLKMIVTHKECCEKALADYLCTVIQLGKYNTVIPKAIIFYQEHGDENEQQKAHS